MNKDKTGYLEATAGVSVSRNACAGWKSARVKVSTFLPRWALATLAHEQVTTRPVPPLSLYPGTLKQSQGIWIRASKQGGDRVLSNLAHFVVLVISETPWEQTDFFVCLLSFPSTAVVFFSKRMQRYPRNTGIEIEGLYIYLFVATATIYILMKMELNQDGNHSSTVATTTMPAAVAENPKIKATSAIPYTLYFGTFIHTPELTTSEICFNTLVGVDSRGEIDYIEKDFEPADGQSPVEYFKEQKKMSCQPQGGSEIDDENIVFVDYTSEPAKFFFPGFIDTHIHASQFPNIGIGLDTPLLDWLNTYTFPLELQFSVKDQSEQEAKFKFAKHVYSKVIQATLENGTTCASYFTAIDAGTTNLFADLLVEMGQRGYVGKVCMDHNEPCPAYSESLETCRKSMDSIISHISKVNPPREHLVEPIVTPRFAPVCSTPMLDYLGEISARDNLPIQTHISENKQEIELVAELFPDCESYAQVYNKHHLLTKRTILAHAIHLTQKECDLVAEKQCSISHCPTSNTFISSGEAPVYKYLYQDKINVSLGTDISGGFDVSILAMVKYAILVSHHLSMKPAQANGVDCKLSMTDGLYMATMGGARAVGLANLVGSFAVGKRFDAQLIDLDVQGARTDVFSWQVPKSGDLLPVKEKKMEDLLGKWIFSGDDRNCVSVWCNGRLVIDKRKPTKN